MPELDVGPIEELPPGSMTLVAYDGREIGVFNCGGALLAMEDRCTHDDGPLCHGVWDTEACTITCPRHGASFDLRTGAALSLPAYLPARTFAVHVQDGIVRVRLD